MMAPYVVDFFVQVGALQDIKVSNSLFAPCPPRPASWKVRLHLLPQQVLRGR